ncbi:Ail/Lom family outer membrane beta-barrel protein [Escherichia coli]|uniref:Ail/Lom family outer membrane beta-barrel protein n=1 Tax=Escherichia coli TaxID=562 RepID=UPI000CFDD954|nr:Ail/Lom family outer membrane beta-barrel protein [Escherichia coli]
MRKLCVPFLYMLIFPCSGIMSVSVSARPLTISATQISPAPDEAIFSDRKMINVKYRYEFTDALGMITSFSYRGERSPAQLPRGSTRCPWEPDGNRMSGVMSGPSVRIRDGLDLHVAAGVSYHRTSTFELSHIAVPDRDGVIHDRLAVRDKGRAGHFSLMWGAGIQFNPAGNVVIDMTYEAAGRGRWRSDAFIVSAGYKF